MRLFLAAGLLAAIFAAPIAGQTQEGPAKWLEDLDRKFPSADKNAAAEQVERLALSLGVGRSTESSSPEDHPTREDLDLYRQAPLGSWLDAQIRTSNDAIAPSPARLNEYLQRKQSTLARLVSVLLRDIPDWGFHLRQQPQVLPDLMLPVRLSRILLSAALAAERAGRHMEAGQMLEASWSLTQSMASRPELISQLLSISLSRMQIGVVRKLAEPPFEWLDRMSSDRPWNQVIDSFENEPLVVRAAEPSPRPASFVDTWSRGLRAAGEEVRDRSACQVSKLSLDELWEPIRRELAGWKQKGVDTEGSVEFFKEGSAESLLQMLQRAARLRVDRELTAKVLELRQEKAASRDHRWPARFLDTDSRVCPAGQYEYEPRGAAMVIRFRGTIEEPETPALALPLSFEAMPPKPPPTAGRPPRRTETPGPHS